MNKTLTGGRELYISTTFEDSHRLFKIVAQELESVKITLGKDFDFKNPFKSDSQGIIDTFKNALLRLLGNERIDEALWKCMARCTLDNKKVNKELFDDEKMREDFIEVAQEVMVANLRPFTKNLGSLLKAIVQGSTNSQSSK